MTGQELSEDVSRHREPERELQQIGAELMKHISSDEALQLKDKLDSVSHRYQDLENKVGDGGTLTRCAGHHLTALLPCRSIVFCISCRDHLTGWSDVLYHMCSVLAAVTI